MAGRSRSPTRNRANSGESSTRPCRAEASVMLYACEGWRDGRVVDGGGLENHCAGNGTGGSNPSPSAKCDGSIPVTWVTVHSEHIGNTFGPNGLSTGSSLHVSS